MSEKPLFKKTESELTEEERIIVGNSDPLYLMVYNNTVDQMFELTDEMKQFMADYPYRSQEDVTDPKKMKVMAHYFNPVCSQDWIVTEYYVDRDEQHYFYGCAKLYDDIGWEWGILPSLEELKSIELGPAFGHLRIERDMSVEVGDSLYDVMTAIDKDGLYDLGFMERSLDDPDRMVDFGRMKFLLLRNVVDDDMYDKTVYYIYKEHLSIDDVFDIDSYYYDRENCFDEDRINEYFETHELPGYDALLDDLASDGPAEEPGKDLPKSPGKENGMDFGKEL